MIIFAAILLLLILVVGLFTVACASTQHGSDAAGNGMSYGFAMLWAIVLWVLLAIFTIVAATQGVMPVWSKLSAIVLIPAAAAGCMGAIQAMKISAELKWPIVCVAIPPALVIAYAAWLFFPTIRSAIPSAAAGGIVWGAIAILAILPWPVRAKVSREEDAIQTAFYAKRAEEEAAKQTAETKDHEDRLKGITADSRLWDCWNLVRYDDLHDRAMEVARGLKNRQADAEEMAKLGYPDLVVTLPELNLNASPTLCENVRGYLVKRVQTVPPFNPAEPHPTSAMDEFDRYLPTIAWLAKNNCDLDAEISAIEIAVKGYPDSPERQTFLATLNASRKSKI